MKKSSEMPMGLSMALMQNENAMSFYNSCTEKQKQAIINQVHSINSKQEMQAFVDHLPSATL